MNESAVAVLKQQHDAGRTIVIATACEEKLAQSVLDAAGIPYDLLSATTFDDERGYIAVVDPRDGIRKAKSLRSAGVPLERAELLTDDISDIPTARECAQVSLVNASPAVVASYRRAGIESVQALLE